MYSKVLLAGEIGHDGIGNTAVADLYRVAILDDLRNIFTDLSGHVILWCRFELQQRLIVRYDEIDITRSMGIGNMTYYGDVRWDGGASCAMVLRAAMAVASGAANNVVVIRSVNDSSLQRRKKDWGELKTWPVVEETFYHPYGLFSDDGRIGMNIRRYIHEHQLNSDSFGWVTQVFRENGARNPNSLFYNNPDGDYYDYDTATVYTGANDINLNLAEASCNVGGDPLFVDKEAGDFHLEDGSAALDRGDASAAPATDFEGDPRPGTDGTSISVQMKQTAPIHHQRILPIRNPSYWDYRQP